MLSKIKTLFKTILETCKKLDAFLRKYRIYQAVFTVLFICIIFIFSNDFSVDKTFRNYIVGDVKDIAVRRNSTYNMSFEAQDSSLNYIRLMINSTKSNLSTQDKVTITISDDQENIVASSTSYLYSGNRNYVIVDFDGVNLQKGEWYYLSFDFSEMSVSSYLYMTTHKINSFTEALSYAQSSQDELSLDMAIGFSNVANITYYYSVTDAVSIIVHLFAFGILISCLFLVDVFKKRFFTEIFRGIYFSILLYMLPEVLNVEKNRAINIFYPLNPKQIFCFLSSLIIIFSLYLLLYTIIGKGSIAMIIVSVLGAVLAFVNHTKLVMRGDSFMPWDLFSAGIGIKTGSTYYFHLTSNFWAGILICVMLLIFIRITDTPYVKFRVQRVYLIMFSLTFTVLVLTTTVFNTRLLNKMKIYYEVNPPIQSYNENGTFMAFLMHINNFEVNGGVNNSPENTEETIYLYTGILSEMELDEDVCSYETSPNVICIMSESFADLRNVREFETSEPFMPFYDSFIDDTIHGNLAVSIFGGGTCNTEFEFLTGYSMANLLPGSSVYSFYVNNEVDALPRIFANNGYRTVALHSFDGSWWDRRDKYPLLGFQEFYTRDDFDESATYVRRYISDMSTFEKITDIYNESEDPLFLFCVTMQNHGDFASRYDNMAYDINLIDIAPSDGSTYYYTENYLSLLRESDDALNYLINYFENCDEPTIICFFGDHFPTLDTGFYSELLQTNLGSASVEESIPIYMTPYFIWANYDLPIDSSFYSMDGVSDVTSPNFLGQTVLDLAGIASPDSRSCLRVLHQHIAAISSLAVFDYDGNVYISNDDIDEEVNGILNDYASVQYGLVYYDTNNSQGEE